MKWNGKDITELLGMNRRNFVKLLIGGAVGTTLSPLPWKLIDDISIFSQNFPWVPVPPVGAFSNVKSVCGLCSGGCGIDVRKVDNRAVKIEARTDYPVNQGSICPIGMGGLQLLYNEQNRFTGPMKRIGPRGSGEFEETSWQEALHILSKRISGLRDRMKADAIVAIDGNPAQSTMSVMIERLMKTIGTPNYMRIPSAEETNLTATYLMQGKTGPISYDLENADYILSFGAGLLEGWGSPGRVLNTWGHWRSGALKGKVKVVQIESRASNTASKADQWVAAKPGTEAALALGFAHVIVRQGLYDMRFIENNAFGFDDWNSPDGTLHKGFKNMVLENYTPGTVEEITGVSAEEIISVAAKFAKARAPVALFGKGKGSLYGSLYEAMAVLALNALVGSINRPGGMLFHEPLPLYPLPDLEMDSVASVSIGKPRIDRGGSNVYPFSNNLFDNLTKAITTGPESPVDTLLSFSANPAFTIPDGGDFRRALARVPFIVSFSPYHDETAFMADLILPDHTCLEKTDDVIWPTGLQYPLFGLTRPVVKPLYNTMNSGDIIIRLAKGIGGSVANSFPWKTYEEVLKDRVKGLFDLTTGLTVHDASMPPSETVKRPGLIKPDYGSFDEMWEKLKSGGLWYRPVHEYNNWGSLFDTPTGKFEFFSHRIEQVVNASDPEEMGIMAKGDDIFMPHYEPVHPETGERHFPLRMVPYEMINLSSGWVPNPPYLNKTFFDDQLLKDDSFAEINPETASKYHLKQGDRVMIESPKGIVEVRVNIFEGAMPGIVYLPLGFGHWAYDAFLRGKGVNPNEIIDGGKDPLSGHSVWWNTPVRLTKA